MLSNAYFLAKFRFDTAENEPAKNLQNFAKFQNLLILPISLTLTQVRRRPRGGLLLRAGARGGPGGAQRGGGGLRHDARGPAGKGPREANECFMIRGGPRRGVPVRRGRRAGAARARRGRAQNL